ncbi:MAG: amino acid adenylation domain-containing protein [Myxococcota bacterium]
MDKTDPTLIFDARLKAEQAYWLGRLRRELEETNLPLDFKRSKIYAPKQESLPFEISEDTQRRLERLTGGSPLLTYTALLAALLVALRRYTGNHTVVVGSPPARVDGQADRANVLPIVADLDDSTSFRELLPRLRDTLSAVYAHQNYPFGRLLEDLGIVAPPSRCPLFDVVASSAALHGPLPPLKNDISFVFVGAPGALALQIVFNARVLHADTVAAFGRSVLCLLDEMLRRPADPLGALPALSGDQARVLVEGWNGTPGETRDPRPLGGVPGLFEAQVDRTPDALAAEQDGRFLTYRVLEQRANQLAHHLRAAGAGPDVPIGIAIAPSLDLLVGVLGILKAGAAYVPLDLALPADRRRIVAEEAGVRIVLVAGEGPSPLPPGVARLIDLDADREVIAATPATRIASPDPEDLAYILFTSGSTGRPKGVCMPHRALTNLLDWQIRQSTCSEGSRTLLRTSLGFDVSFQEIFATWCAGGTLVVASEAIRSDPWGLPAFLEAKQINRVFLPFIGLQQLAKGMCAQQRFPTTLREVITAGEPLRITSAILEVFRQLEGCSLVNQYGPTETHVVTANVLDGPAIRWPTLPSIGRPIANTQVYVLDAWLQPVPMGAVGELCVGGVAVARGYAGRPELTERAFPVNPFVPGPTAAAARLYRTGDLARHRRNGEIELLGRADRQVKIRGHRVELGEVEAALCVHPEVGEAVAMGTTGDDGDTRLVAWVVPEHGHRPSSAALRAYLAERLPPAMIPAAFVRVDTLPLTSTGKIDRAALPAPDWAHPEIEDPFVAPRTPVEQLLAEVWRAVLGVERVGIAENFLELGGDSILATQVVARARAEGVGISLRDIFQHQTVAALALVASTARTRDVTASGPAPLSAIQRWLLDRELPNPSHWNMSVLLQTRFAHAPGLLAGAMRAVVAHHDALRLQLVQDGAGWRQAAGLSAHQALAVVHHDLSALPAHEQPGVVTELAAAAQRMLDLHTGPMVVMATFDLGAERPGRVLFAAHHLVMDGVSLRFLLADVETAARQLAGGEPVALPPPTAPFLHWARLTNELAQSPRLHAELEYWERRPATPPARLPLDRPDGPNTEESTRTVERSLGAAETRAVLHGTPEGIRDVVLGALVVALSRFTGSRAVLVDVEGHGREELAEAGEFARTVGWFTSLFPVCFDIGDAPAPGEVLRAVHARLRAVPGNGVGYGLLRHLAGPQIAARLAALPAAEVSFNYLGQFDALLAESALFALAPESPGPQVDPRGARTHALYVEGRIVHGQLLLSFRYSAALHDAATMEQVADHCMAALGAMRADPVPAARAHTARVSAADLQAVLAAVRTEDPSER